MLKRVLIGLVVLAGLVCLAAVLFVTSYEPTPYPRTGVQLEETPEGGLRWSVRHMPRTEEEETPWSSAHIRRGGATFDPEGPDECAYDFVIVRGALDPTTGTFPLAVGCIYRDWDALQEARLEVTSDDDWTLDEAAWTVLATEPTQQKGRWQTVLIKVDAPAGTRGLQLVVDKGGLGDESWSFGCSLPGSNDWRDRLYEVLVGFPLLRGRSDD